MKTLPITWQRLVSDGQTCPRCAQTGSEVERAYEQLKKLLLPLQMEPVLEIKELDMPKFLSNPAESNRIWIAGKPIEDWLQASVESSPCCSVCGESECRTMTVDEGTFEAIPEELLVKAAMIAALTLHSRQDSH